MSSATTLLREPIVIAHRYAMDRTDGFEPLGKRFERFANANGIRRTYWAERAGLARQTLRNIANGSEPCIGTIRVLVLSGAEILQRPLRAREIFDVGEDTPVRGVTIVRRSVAEYRRRALKAYDTPLDRALRREQIEPTDFAHHIGVVRQSLLRYRDGSDEPCLFVLAAMVKTLRAMTGKPYRACYLYDIGERDKGCRCTASAP